MVQKELLARTWYMYELADWNLTIDDGLGNAPVCFHSFPKYNNFMDIWNTTPLKCKAKRVSLALKLKENVQLIKQREKIHVICTCTDITKKHNERDSVFTSLTIKIKNWKH